MPAFSTIATIVGAGLGAGATVYAGSKASSAARQAGAAQERGTQAAIDMQWRMFQQQRADFAPWREAGISALSALERELFGPTSPELSQARENLRTLELQLEDARQASPLGTARDMPTIPLTGTIGQGAIAQLLGQAQTSPAGRAITDLEAQVQQARDEVARLEGQREYLGPGEFVPEDQPGYRFGFEEFIRKPYEQAQSAKGKRLSGETLKGLTGFAQDYASTQYDNFLNRYYQSLNPLQSLAGVGLTGTSQIAQLGGQTAASIAGLQTRGAEAQAQNALTQGAIGINTATNLANVGGNALNQYLNYQMLQKLGVT